MISGYIVSRDVFVNLSKEVLVSCKLTLRYEKTLMQWYIKLCTTQDFFVKRDNLC